MQPNAFANMFVGAGLLYFYQNHLGAFNKETVRRALEAWGMSVAFRTPQQVAALYASNGVLVGTFAPSYVEGRSAITDYFVDLQQKEDLRVQFDSLHVQLQGEIAIASGNYTFTWKEEMQSKGANARFSFVLEKKGGRVYILNHHSSLVP
jgi:uncharacterized protein (TIGR02246 family)